MSHWIPYHPCQGLPFCDACLSQGKQFVFCSYVVLSSLYVARPSYLRGRHCMKQRWNLQPTILLSSDEGEGLHTGEVCKKWIDNPSFDSSAARGKARPEGLRRCDACTQMLMVSRQFKIVALEACKRSMRSCGRQCVHKSREKKL